MHTGGIVRAALADSAPATSAASQRPKALGLELDFLLVLDFEATCEDRNINARFGPQEIIEWPVALLNLRTLEVEDEFHHYVRPVQNPTLTAFCTELTGIQQSWVDSAPTFETALRQHTSWLRQHGLAVNGIAGHS